MKYLHKKIEVLFTVCVLALSVVVPCLTNAATQHYYIRPLRTGDTIYYDNSISEWSTVKIYIFSLAEQTHPFEWDERPDMTYVDNNIWEYTVTAGSNIEGHDYDYVIFTNGKSGSNSRQTVDIGFVGNGYAYKSDSWEGSKRSGYWYLYDTTAVTLEYVTALKTGDVIYFDNSGTNWDGVNVYMYNPDNTGSGSGPFAWNGTAMTYVSGGIYEYTVPADINIESYNDTHVVFSNTAGSSQTIDLGFFKSGYAYKVESWKDGKGTGYWYVYDKSSLQAAIDEVSSYLDKLGCLSPSDYAAATQAVADANRAMNSEIPEEAGVPGDPGAYWNQVNVEISNLQSKLASLKETYGETPTVCTFSPAITKTITNPQEYYKLGDTVEFRIDITNTAEFDITATITENLNGVVFSDPSTDNYTVISDQVAETKTMSAGETVSLYATYPVVSDITEQYTNIAEITSASTTEAGYYLSESDHTASAVFDTKSWMDIPSSTACTLSSTITSDDEHTATILPGAYKDNIGKTEIKALCNDNDGFSIYAVGYSNNTKGTNTMIGQTTGSTIATGTSTEGDTSNWAMKLTKITDPSVTFNPNNLSISGGYDSYSPVPSTPTKVVEYKDSDTSSSSATDQTKGAHIETTYAAYIASTQPADTYNGKVKYLLVHPANFTTGTYSIAYNANGGTGTMNTETGIPNYEPHTLAASTLTAPTGYMLAGWCDAQDTEATAQSPQTTCAGTSYQDKATIMPSTVVTSSTLNLYAYWEKLPTYSIHYNANGGTGTMEEAYILTYEPHTLAASTLTAPAGYKLVGWCSAQDTEATAENPQTTCEGETYATDATIPASTMATGSTMTLYAYWKKLPIMQEISTWKNTLTTDETITAIDNRDGKEYTVAKLQDGKVWMTRNLDLQKEDLKAGITLDSTNTDHPASGFVLPDSQTSGKTKWYNSSNEEASINTAHVYDLNDNGEVYHYCVRYNEFGSCTAYGDEVIPSEDLGNYYNWYSATAGTGTYSLGGGEVATGSICPAGWRLPTGATSNSTATDWSTLLKEYGVIARATGDPSVYSGKLPSIFESPISLVRAGSYGGGGVYGVGAYGNLWSSMANGSGNARYFYFYRTRVEPWYYNSKYSGYSVRCVAE